MATPKKVLKREEANSANSIENDRPANSITTYPSDEHVDVQDNPPANEGIDIYALLYQDRDPRHSHIENVEC